MRFKPEKCGRTSRSSGQLISQTPGLGRWMLIGSSLFGASVLTSLAQTNLPASELRAPTQGIWQAGVGNGFNEGTFQSGISLGAGFGWAAFGSRKAHDLALTSVNFGWVTSDVMAKGQWFQGNWEIGAEVSGGAQISPEYRYLVGVTPLVHYNLVTGTRWVPFFCGGVGVMATDIDHPDLGSTLQFDPQAGLGTHYFLRDNLALTLDYRWLHISNAGIRQPNHGVNTQMFSLGLNWFF